MNSDQPTYYEILSVDRDATSSEINAAFRKKARELHPDRFVGHPDVHDEAERLFKRVSEAYSVLHDPRTRSGYDRFLSAEALAINVEPAALHLRTMSGRFVVRGLFSATEQVGFLPLDVSCADAGVDLESVDIAADEGRAAPIEVRGYVTAGRSRVVTLNFVAGSAAAAQIVRFRMPPASVRRIIGYVPPPTSEPAAFISFIGVGLFFAGAVPALITLNGFVWFMFMLFGMFCWAIAATLAFVVTVATRGRRRMAVRMRARW